MSTTVPTYAQQGMIGRRGFFDGAFHDIEGEATAENITLTGGLHFTVRKDSIAYPHPDGVSDPIISPKHGVMWGHDQLTGEWWPIDSPVGRETYTAIQDDPIVEALAGVAATGLVQWHGVSTFNNRARIAMWGTVGEEFKLEGDPHQKICVARWSHDGSWSAGFKSFVGRYWCGNIVPGMILSTGRKADVSIKHTRSSEFRVPLLADAITASLVAVEDYEKVFMRLYDKKVSPVDLENYIERLFPISKLVEQAPDHLLTPGQKAARTRALNKRAAVREIFWDGPTQVNLFGTAAGLFHAAVETFDHRISGDRGYKIINGDDEKAKAQALEIALAL